MQNKLAKRMHLKFYLMFHFSKNMTVHLKVPLCIHLKSQQYLRLELSLHLEVTVELNLKMHMVVPLLVQKSAQNDSIEVGIEDVLFAALENAPKTYPGLISL